MTRIDATLLRRHGGPAPRYTSYPGVPSWDTPPTAAQWLEHLSAAFDASDAPPGAAMYIHIPFCHAMCTFCGCNMRVTRNHSLVMPYVDTVLREWRLLRERLGRPRVQLGELHLGGGTPTYLHAEELDALLAGVFAAAEATDDASLTIEADPRTTHRDQLQVLRRYGFNRLSLGVQDLDPRVQDIVNRVQDAERIAGVTADARELGFTSINYDLIYGLPLQTADSIVATMEAVMRLAPDRVAFYSYTHVPWIKPSQRRFTEADLPEGDARRELYQLGRDRLTAAGYVDIGMDHFARPGDALAIAARDGSLNRNFMGYSPTRAQPLLGLGVSAISDAGTAFAQNDKNLQQYEARIARDELPLQRGHVLNAEDRVLRRHIGRLLTRYETRWTASVDYTPWLDRVPERLEPLAQEGLVELGDGEVRVTDSGRAFLRYVCLAFDARLQRRARIEAVA